MKNEYLDEFGETLIRGARDSVIDKWEGIFAKKAKAPRLQEISKHIKSLRLEPEELAKHLVPLVVDSCLSAFLHCVESEEKLTLLFDGHDLKSESDGLAGELYGANGWITKFSKKPHDE